MVYDFLACKPTLQMMMRELSLWTARGRTMKRGANIEVLNLPEHELANRATTLAGKTRFPRKKMALLSRDPSETGSSSRLVCVSSGNLNVCTSGSISKPRMRRGC